MLVLRTKMFDTTVSKCQKVCSVSAATCWEKHELSFEHFRKSEQKKGELFTKKPRYNYNTTVINHKICDVDLCCHLSGETKSFYQSHQNIKLRPQIGASKIKILY